MKDGVQKPPFPSYPLEPTVVEYEVDPGWPKRPARLGPPQAVAGIAVDRNDRIWCAQRGEEPIQAYTTAGELVRSWGRGQFSLPHALRMDGQRNVWVSDAEQHTVRKFTREGELLMPLGVKGQAGDDGTHFNRPTDVAVTPAGDIFVTDGYGNRRVVHFDGRGRFVKEWGTFGSGPGEFVLPHQIVMDSRGTLYVADRNSGRIQVFDQQGRFLQQWANIIMPWGLWISPSKSFPHRPGKPASPKAGCPACPCGNDSDEIWCCGTSPQWWRKGDQYPPPKDQIVVRFAADGRVLQLWSAPIGKEGQAKPGELNWVHAIALDSRGSIYLGEITGKRAQRFVRNPPLSETAAR